MILHNPHGLVILKELSIFFNWYFSTPQIFPTQCPRLQIFQTMNSVRSNIQFEISKVHFIRLPLQGCANQNFWQILKKSATKSLYLTMILICRMQKIYKHPDDVDLFPGLLSERKLAGALTGPTLTCLIGLQFSHLRYDVTLLKFFLMFQVK